MDKWNGFACSYDYVSTYGNRKGPHKQSLIIKMSFHFQNFNFFHFLKVLYHTLSKLAIFLFFESDDSYSRVKNVLPLVRMCKTLSVGRLC